jgi:hypothetical protein
MLMLIKIVLLIILLPVIVLMAPLLAPLGILLGLIAIPFAVIGLVGCILFFVFKIVLGVGFFLVCLGLLCSLAIFL